jgi:hypothetical protein
MRLGYVLPILGLLLFAAQTVASLHAPMPESSRYFYWGALRIDRAHDEKRAPQTKRCDPNDASCAEWDPDSLWIDASPMQETLLFSGIPAWIAIGVFMYLAAKVDVNQIACFFVTAPVLLTAWYWLAGSCIDRVMARRSSA